MNKAISISLMVAVALDAAAAIEFPSNAPWLGKTKSQTCAEQLFGSWDCTVKFPEGLPYVAEVQRLLGIFGNSGTQVEGRLRQKWTFSGLRVPEATREIKVGIPPNLYSRHSTRQNQNNNAVSYPPWLQLDIADAETGRKTFEGSCTEPTLVAKYLLSKYPLGDFPYIGYCIDYFTSFCACKVKRKHNYFSSKSSLVQSSNEFVCNFPDVQNTAWHNLPYIKYQHFAWDGHVEGNEMSLTGVSVFAPPNDCFEIFCRVVLGPLGAATQAATTILQNQASETNFCANNCLFPNFSHRAVATCSKTGHKSHGGGY